MSELQPDHIDFYDAARNRSMRYMYPGSGHHFAGWLLYQNSGDGRWVTLRKATDKDIMAINGAVVKACHVEME